MKNQEPDPRQLLSNALEDVDTPAGRQRVADHLESLPLPHYQAVAGRPDLL